MANETPQPAEQAAAPAGPEANPGEGKRRITIARDWVRNGVDRAFNWVGTTRRNAHDSVYAALGDNNINDPAKDVSPLSSPFHATGHFINGTAGTVAVEGLKALEPVEELIGGALRTVREPLLHPIKTLTNLGTYLKGGPLRMLTSIPRILAQPVARPLSALNRFVNIGVRKPIETLSQQPAKLVEGINWPANAAPRLGGWITQQAKNLGDFLTTPFRWAAKKTKEAADACNDVFGPQTEAR